MSDPALSDLQQGPLARDGARRPNPIRGGRHGFSPEQVATSQRERLLVAMTELACRRGYQRVRVGDLVQQAGVSRRTFYELYEGKEECLIAAYEQALADLLAPALAAYESGGAWLDRLRRALDALLAALAADPLAARLCFVEVLGAGPQAVARRNRGMAALDRVFEGPEGGEARPAVVAAGRVGDLGEILNREIAAGRSERLPRLRGELMYTLVLPFLGPEAAARELELEPPASRASSAEPGTNGHRPGMPSFTRTPPPLWSHEHVDLSRGHHDLTRDEVQAVQRERLLRALSLEVAEHGYHETTIRALARRAGVSARSVYELFEGKEDCFLAAYDEIAEYLLGAIGDAMRESEETPAGQLAVAVEVVLGFCVREPDLARVALVEVAVAGPAARARRERAMRRFAELLEPPLRELRPGAPLQPVAARALVGALHELVFDAVDRRDPTALPDAQTVCAVAGGEPLVAA